MHRTQNMGDGACRTQKPGLDHGDIKQCINSNGWQNGRLPCGILLAAAIVLILPCQLLNIS